MKELGSEVARQPEGDVARQSKSSQSRQPNPNPDHDRTVKTVVCPQRGASQTRFSHDSTNFNVEDETKHDRTEKPVVCRDANHERSMIENHPHRQSLQRDLQQNQAHNLFCPEPKKMVQDMGNIELFELFETDPKTQCKECQSYWNEGIVYFTCGHLLKVQPTEASSNIHWVRPRVSQVSFWSPDPSVCNQAFSVFVHLFRLDGHRSREGGCNAHFFAWVAASIFECWFSSWFWSWPRWNGHPLWKYNEWQTRCPSLNMCTLRNSDRSNSCSLRIHVPYGYTHLENTWRFCDSTYRDGTEFQRLHRTYVQVRDICCLSIKRFRFGLILAYARTSWRLHSRRVPWPRVIRRLDTSSSAEDEQSRSAVLLRFPCEQYLKGITMWIGTLREECDMLACNKPVRFHCKAGSVSIRLVFETRSKCQDFVARKVRTQQATQNGTSIKLGLLTKSEMSLGFRSFLHRVNDQVRKRQKQSSINATEDSEEHSVIWRMFMSSTLQASVFMGKNYSDNWHSIKNTKDLTMNRWEIDIRTSDEVYGVNTINWEDSSWKYLSLIGDEQVISLQRTKVYVFSDSVLSLGKMNENP